MIEIEELLEDWLHVGIANVFPTPGADTFDHWVVLLGHAEVVFAEELLAPSDAFASHERNETSTLHRGGYLGAGQVERGGGDVDVEDEFRSASTSSGLGGARIEDDERHADGRVIEQFLAAKHIIAHHVAVVAEKDDHGVLRQTALGQRFADSTDRTIRTGDQAVVISHYRLILVGRAESLLPVVRASVAAAEEFRQRIEVAWRCRGRHRDSDVSVEVFQIGFRLIAEIAFSGMRSLEAHREAPGPVGGSSCQELARLVNRDLVEVLPRMRLGKVDALAVEAIPTIEHL